MSNCKPSTPSGMDWTGLLADPDLAPNLGKLLKIYRDAPPGRKEEALVDAMREIKRQSSIAKSSAASKLAGTRTSENEISASLPTATVSTPPFEPDIFGANWGQDRRRSPRIKCFVAVELRVNGSNTPVWGNVSNTGLGGCQIETAANFVTGGAKVEIGLWVANGKIWVKGIALNGIVTQTTSGRKVRIRFDALERAEKESLRQFLKYVQEVTRFSANENSYLQMLK